MKEISLEIRGMHCASCVGRVEQALARVPGVERARVNLALGQAAVSLDPSSASIAALASAVSAAGYEAREMAPAADAGVALAERTREEVSTWRNRLLIAGVLLVPLIGLHWLPGLSHSVSAWGQFALATALQIVVGWPFLLGAASRLRHGGANMDTLIALGTLAAYGAGVADLAGGRHGMNFMDGGMILAFITLGKYLEARAKGRASLAILKLLRLAPPVARVERNLQLAEVPVGKVAIGETILIRPGDKVPLDGVVLTGSSELDEAWLTGEPLPVAKKPGDTIYAGSTSGSGSLRARVTRAAGDTWLAQTVALVRQAQESKANVQRLADWVVAWFVPAVLVVAAITVLAWGFVGEWTVGVSCAVAVLVVACPCALGLATPAAILVGSGRGAENGILIKDAQALETAGRITAIVLDKTGTITLGRPEVVAVRPAVGFSAERVLELAAAAERHSSHPLARAIVAQTEALGLKVLTADSVRVVPGQGLVAESSAGQIAVGTEELVGTLHPPVAPVEPGQIVIQVGVNGKLAGTIVLADAISDSSRAAISDLKSLGLAVTMLSGDRQAAAEAVARHVGIERVIAEVKPEGKQAAIVQMQANGAVVAMVGDGINDAPALAAADLGIAIGLGADVAIETAPIVLSRHDLRLVPRAIRLSRAVLAVIRQNLVWALVYNVLLIPLAAGLFEPLIGLRLPPALAAAAMAASSVSVVVNSLRLRWISLAGEAKS
ncbi:MAG: heavy metal translocating P-type ATPase [Pirellulaceae bacterium]|nr:heavy metal translocating P-type ATPase [Pirellulaceae bacterium]